LIVRLGLWSQANVESRAVTFKSDAHRQTETKIGRQADTGNFR
jgi:hypothetical protein